MSDNIILAPRTLIDHSLGPAGMLREESVLQRSSIAHRNHPVDFVASEKRTDASDGVTASLRHSSHVASCRQKAYGQNICSVQAQSELCWLVSR
jgi:hypothetical protein